ncbi:hypothetical protein Dimus_022966 [Dionaea muscipula]
MGAAVDDVSTKISRRGKSARSDSACSDMSDKTLNPSDLGIVVFEEFRIIKLDPGEIEDTFIADLSVSLTTVKLRQEHHTGPSVLQNTTSSYALKKSSEKEQFMLEQSSVSRSH